MHVPVLVAQNFESQASVSFTTEEFATLLAERHQFRSRLTAFGFSEKGRFLGSAPLCVLANSALNNRPKQRATQSPQKRRENTVYSAA